mmetsp:Transcript_20444/g.44440  ORF Transcript_20444/g.44440 Transcript_20444/m.44440 type:complete len:221 (-) Transcript_20444:380-1042(-)
MASRSSTWPTSSQGRPLAQCSPGTAPRSPKSIPPIPFMRQKSPCCTASQRIRGSVPCCSMSTTLAPRARTASGGDRRSRSSSRRPTCSSSTAPSNASRGSSCAQTTWSASTRTSCSRALTRTAARLSKARSPGTTATTTTCRRRSASWSALAAAWAGSTSMRTLGRSTSSRASLARSRPSPRSFTASAAHAPLAPSSRAHRSHPLGSTFSSRCAAASRRR